jgi:hypothetical protein
MIKRLIHIILTLTLFLLAKYFFAQVPDDIEKMEDSLKSLSVQIQNAANDSAKLFFNNRFHETLYRTLLLKGSFAYPFDSLRTIAKLTSPDNKFRLYNWNLPKGDGSNIYYGFIQLNPKGNEDHSIYDLTDQSDSLTQPETGILDNNSWYGSLYYKIILTTINDQQFYTLLGWDGLNLKLTQKIIDVLSFDKSNHPRFGAKIFRNLGKEQVSRVFFKYSSSASMVLKYEDQYLIKNKKWNSSTKIFETERVKEWMIVCDELIPLDPQLEGQYEYYVPSSEVFNGFVFKDGTWNFYKNVDVRNKRN